MQKIMYVEGMMCAHCEARVRKALEALPSWRRQNRITAPGA